MPSSFSGRHGLTVPDPDITVRDDAPQELRDFIIEIAQRAGYTAQAMRSIIFLVLHVPADPDASSYDWVINDVRYRLGDAAWFHVYDVIEELYAPADAVVWHEDPWGNRRRGARSRPAIAQDLFSRELNQFFRAQGIGWQLVDGKVEARGSESFEHDVRGTIEQLGDTGRDTAASELREAIRDLSRRPEPDLSGAVHHAMNALECTERDVTGDPNSTLGAILKRHPQLIPKPLDTAVEKAWGYASNRGRHIEEGNLPSYRDAELIVGISAVLCRYLS